MSILEGIGDIALIIRAAKAEDLLRKAADLLTAMIGDLLHSFCVIRDDEPDETTMEPDEAILISKMRADLAEIEAFLAEEDQAPDMAEVAA